MRNLFLILGASALLICASEASAATLEDKKDLAAIRRDIKTCIEEISRAQKRNDYAMGGHATRAVLLLKEADQDLAQAKAAAREAK